MGRRVHFTFREADEAMRKFATCNHRWGPIKGTKARPYRVCLNNCGRTKKEPYSS